MTKRPKPRKRPLVSVSRRGGMVFKTLNVAVDAAEFEAAMTRPKKPPAVPTYAELMNELAELTEHAHCVLDGCNALKKLFAERERRRWKPSD